MTKRAFGKFKRRAQDCYDTPADAVTPLREHLSPQSYYWEPCAGSGSLTDALPGCIHSSDLRPRREGIIKADALRCRVPHEATHIITNPPWTRQILHPMIEHFAAMRPTWLLFDADWMHTKQAAPFLGMCQKIVSVGRVSWMQNGTSGFDNCAWYLFDAHHAGPTEFVGRTLSLRSGDETATYRLPEPGRASSVALGTFSEAG